MTNDPQTYIRDQLANVAERTLKPSPVRSGSQFADEERFLSSESSAEPGRWDTSRAEYQREVLDTIADPTIETTVLMWSAQTGKTEVLLNADAYFILEDPAPVLNIYPTLELAEAYSKDRLAPMLRDCPNLATVFDRRTRRSENTILHKAFPGGNLTIAGANSPASLSSRPKRVLKADEIDRYKASAGSEGNPINLGRARLKTFWNRKVILASTPLRQSTSQIWAAWLESDQRFYYILCVHCEAHHPLSFLKGMGPDIEGGFVTWDEDDPETARHVCPCCGALKDDAEINWGVTRGKWVATEPDHRTRGYHINELYSPWVSLSETVAEYQKTRDDPEQAIVFLNTAIGWPLKDDQEKTEIDALLDRREDYTHQQIPMGVKIITAGVDVQSDRLEVEILGHGDFKETWSLEYRVLPGYPSHHETWQLLDTVLGTRYTREDGKVLGIAGTAVDSSAFTSDVYGYCRPRFDRRVFAVKGEDGDGRPICTRPKRPNKLGMKPAIVGTYTAKDRIFELLKREEGQGFQHFPLNRNRNYFDMLVSERPETVRVKGALVRKWIQIGGPNEALDCRVYALAALEILGVDPDRPTPIGGKRKRKRRQISRGI